MKQIYKKKPEYLNVIEVEDDTNSVKEIFELVNTTSANISFDESGNRIITLENGTVIPVGSMVFEKNGNIIVTTKNKLLQVYDVYNESSEE